MCDSDRTSMWADLQFFSWALLILMYRPTVCEQRTSMYLYIQAQAEDSIQSSANPAQDRGQER